jgi:hypothetical protein
MSGRIGAVRLNGSALLPRPTGELSAQLTEGVFVDRCALAEKNIPSVASGHHLPRWAEKEGLFNA